MGLETGTYIDSLVVTNPLGSDAKSAGDDHIRLLKSTIKATFPNITGEVLPTQVELNYVDGVTSAIQTQLNGKASIGSYQAADITLDGLAALDTTLGLVEQISATGFTKRALGSAGGVQLYDAATAKTNVKQTFTAQQTPKSGALTDGASITWDGDSNGQIVTLTLGGNRTMAAPTNIVQNTVYLIRIAQDATGSRLLTWDAAFKFGSTGAPILTTTASGVDFVSFVGGAANTLECLGTRLNAVI